MITVKKEYKDHIVIPIESSATAKQLRLELFVTSALTTTTRENTSRETSIGRLSDVDDTLSRIRDMKEGELKDWESIYDITFDNNRRPVAIASKAH